MPKNVFRNAREAMGRTWQEMLGVAEMKQNI
jgi:hypothetical protein